jgi:SAM-dependent methyltransferase/alpha-beta hydrolase superfamily lysophospholipase
MKLKSLSQQAEELVPQKSSSFVWNQRTPPPQHCSIPLYFNCLGGNWEGQILLLKTDSLELRIQGLPPVKAGQELQFQCFGQQQASFSQLTNGIIQKVYTRPGSSAWEGTTHIIIKRDTSQRTENCSLISKKDSGHTELGSFMLSRLVAGEAFESCETESLAPRLPTFQSSSASNKGGLKTPVSPESENIQSTRLSIPNGYGHTIKAYQDFPKTFDLSTLPIVVIAPGYGETKRDYLTLAYYFASNGFHVIRYDHTNHVGESQGTHFDISLSSMKHDFQTVTHFVRQQWPHRPVIGVASSLASRVALKAEAEESCLTLLILLVGVVDVRRSVATVHQEDVFANYLNGQIQDSANILGFNVGRHFLHDAIANNFSTLNTTLKDVQDLETRVMYISAGRDAWIDDKDLQAFKPSIASHLSKWLEVPEALHRLQENPKAARTTYRHIIDHCREFLGISSQEYRIQEPNRLDLGRQNRQEKTALQQRSHADVGQAFWSDYLGHFQTVGKCQAYVQLLDHVFHALGPITPGQRFLDAGCGNGNAGLFFLQSLQKSNNQPGLISEHPIRYVGIDVIHEALGRAQFQMTRTYHSLQKAWPAGLPPVQMSWSQVDLQHSLPFADNQFDRIVSNLVLGYVADPQKVLRELFRVLAPGGRMVISNLKPNGDFSGIYQNLVSHAGQMDQKIEARELLNNYGKIRQAEKEGQFRFFDQTEWRNILDSLNGVHTGVYPTFAKQAYLIVVEKPATSPEISLFPLQEAGSHFQSFNSSTNAFKKVA